MSVTTPGAVRKQIGSGQADPIYLLLGDDEIEKSALAAEFGELIDEGLRAFNVERIDAGAMTTGDKLADGVAALVSAARTLPMMAPRRVVMVTRAEGLLAPKRESEAATRALDEFEALVKKPEPETALVLVAGAVDKRGRLYKLLAKHATLVECGGPDDVTSAERWVRARIAASGVEIDQAGARAMAERAGFPDRPRPDGRSGDVGRLRGEIERLLLYAMGQKRITLADVRAIAGSASLQDDWALANAVERSDGAEALRQLTLTLDAGAAPEAVLGQLAWVVRSKFPQAAPDRLREAVDAVFRTDLDLKRSNRSSDQPRILLERLIVELCAR